MKPCPRYVKDLYRASNPWAAKQRARSHAPASSKSGLAARGDMASRKSVPLSLSLSQSPFRFPFSYCLLLTVCSWSRGQEPPLKSIFNGYSGGQKCNTRRSDAQAVWRSWLTNFQKLRQI